MNRPVREVLKEVIYCLFITEPYRIEMRGSKRGRITTSCWVLKRNRLFKCHEKKTKPREREENRETQQKYKAQERRKERSAMHDNAWTCYMPKKIASWVKTQSKLQHLQGIISHTMQEYMKHYYNEHRMQCMSMWDHFNRTQPKSFHRTQFFPKN